MNKLHQMNSLVRPLSKADLARVGALSDQLGYPCNQSDLEVRLEKLLQESRHALFVYDDVEVSGWIHLEAVLDLIEEVKVEIKALVVDESKRGKGIGHALVSEAKEWAKTIGVRKVYLSCNIMREKTHQFYFREGFQQVKTSHFFELEI